MGGVAEAKLIMYLDTAYASYTVGPTDTFQKAQVRLRKEMKQLTLINTPLNDPMYQLRSTELNDLYYRYTRNTACKFYLNCSLKSERIELRCISFQTCLQVWSIPASTSNLCWEPTTMEPSVQWLHDNSCAPLTQPVSIFDLLLLIGRRYRFVCKLEDLRQTCWSGFITSNFICMPPVN